MIIGNGIEIFKEVYYKYFDKFKDSRWPSKKKIISGGELEDILDKDDTLNDQ